MRDETDIVVVGGGPVGLTLAHALGARQLRTLLVEQRRQLPERSMAMLESITSAPPLAFIWTGASLMPTAG